jgi:pimeloyl-ACP methyl ester carboxylesterase
LSRPTIKGSQLRQFAPFEPAANPHVTESQTNRKIMENAHLNGATLQYEMTGGGDPVLLVSPVLADGFLPFFSQPALAGQYQLIRYHRRGWAGSTHTPAPVSIADHAADAAALLAYLGISRAHIVGHSSGGTICLQLALDHSAIVQTITLLEPTLLSLASAEPFFQKAGPALQAYAAGEHEKAVAIFLSAASGLDWERCRSVLEEHAPGTVAQAVKDADTFFGIELPSLGSWTFTREDAAKILQPVLSVTGATTEPLWVDIAALLRAWLPRVEDCTIEGLGHLLHLQRPEPVADVIARFLAQHPIESSETRNRRGPRTEPRSDAHAFSGAHLP